MPSARAAAIVSRTAATTAGRPKRLPASIATAVRRTSSTEGNLRSVREADFAIAPSITVQGRAKAVGDTNEGRLHKLPDRNRTMTGNAGVYHLVTSRTARAT